MRVCDEGGHVRADEHLPHTHPEHAQWSRPGLLCLLDVLHWLLGSEHPQPLPSCCRTSGRSKPAARSPSSSPRRPTTRCARTPKSPGVHAFPAAAVNDSTTGIRCVGRPGPRLRRRQAPQPGQIRHRRITHGATFRSVAAIKIGLAGVCAEHARPIESHTRPELPPGDATVRST